MKHVIHESEIEPIQLPGRIHKILMGPESDVPCDNMCFGTALYPQKSMMPSHVHHNQDKIIYVLSGYGEIYLNGTPEKIEKGSCVVIPKNCRHAIKNDSDKSMKVAYVISPMGSVSKTGLNNF